MLALNITATEVSSQLRQIQQEAPGGRTDLGGMEQSVRTVATVQTARQLAQMEISIRDGRRVRLDQVADVSDSIAERRSAALFNGKQVVGFEIMRSLGASDVEVGNGVARALESLKQTHPQITVERVFNMVDQVYETYKGSMEMIFEGALLAVIVVIFFLRNTRATIVAATALPLAVIPTFALMYLFGFTINMVTLLSLSLVVGVLVDDAIVEIENIMRHLEMGKTPYQAAMEAADEIGMAVIATTFTLVAVFLPTAFMSGIPGRFFVQFGWTAAVAVLFSLVVARLLTPMMSAYFLQPRVAHATPEVDRDLSQMGAVVSGESQDDAGDHRSVLRRFVHAGRHIADGIPAQGQPVANPGDADPAAGQQVRADLCAGRAGAQHHHAEPERVDGLYRDRRRHVGRQCVRADRRFRSAQGHAFHPAQAAQRARDRSRRSRTNCARR